MGNICYNKRRIQNFMPFDISCVVFLLYYGKI
nr:MAG TPA: hypothetical protein [Caudoviricetes sp.]